jgi:hypothetical protein
MSTYDTDFYCISTVVLTGAGFSVDAGLPVTNCSGLQTVAPEPANKRSFRLSLGANRRACEPTLPANEPTFPANSLQTAR